MTTVRLTGQVSLCPTCGLIFTSTYSFDQHRTGKVGTPERRCSTDTELRDKGWEPDPRGRWRLPMPDAVRAEKEALHA